MPRPAWISIVSSVCALLVSGGCQRSIDLNNIREYTHIRSFDGHLNPEDGLVHAEIYVLDRRSVGMFDDFLEQNIVEVTTAKGTSRYQWPDDFGAGWSEVVDLDGDGWREFVFISGLRARVLSFRSGSFMFRSREDVLMASSQSIRLLDVNGDGRLEFVTFGPVLLDPKAPPGAISVANWTQRAGFDRSAPTPAR